MKSSALVFIPALFLTVLLLNHFVFATPVNLPLAGAANTSRPCSHFGIAGQTIVSDATTSHRTATAVTVSAQAMVTCDNDTSMVQGPSGVTGATGQVVLWDHVPYWFLSETGGQYFAFTKQPSEADGSCYVIECR